MQHQELIDNLTDRVTQIDKAIELCNKRVVATESDQKALKQGEKDVTK